MRGKVFGWDEFEAEAGSGVAAAAIRDRITALYQQGVAEQERILAQMRAFYVPLIGEINELFERLSALGDDRFFPDVGMDLHITDLIYDDLPKGCAVPDDDKGLVATIAALERAA